MESINPDTYLEFINDATISNIRRIQSEYQNQIEYAKRAISDLSFSSWTDEVATKVSLYCDELNQNYYAKISNDIGTGNLNTLISKLEELKTKLVDLKKANAEYNKWYNISVKLRKYIEANGTSRGFSCDGLSANTFESIKETGIRSRYNSSSSKRNNLSNEINQLLTLISSITFGNAIQNTNIDTVTGASPSNGGVTTTQETIASYYDDAYGWHYNVTMTTTESQDQKIIERNIVCTDDDGNVVNTENITITIDKNDPRVIRVDDDGEVYETRVNEEGQLVEVERSTDKHGNSHTEETPISANGYQVTVTNENTGETTTYTFESGSQADLQVFQMIYENARMQEGYRVEFAGEGMHHLTLGATDSMTIQGVFTDSEGITITIDR